MFFSFLKSAVFLTHIFKRQGWHCIFEWNWNAKRTLASASAFRAREVRLCFKEVYSNMFTKPFQPAKSLGQKVPVVRCLMGFPQMPILTEEFPPQNYAITPHTDLSSGPFCEPDILAGSYVVDSIILLHPLLRNFYFQVFVPGPECQIKFTGQITLTHNVLNMSLFMSLCTFCKTSFLLIFFSFLAPHSA